jgi:hypothetical protein
LIEARKGGCITRSLTGIGLRGWRLHEEVAEGVGQRNAGCDVRLETEGGKWSAAIGWVNGEAGREGLKHIAPG